MPKPPTPITSLISNSPTRVPTGKASLASGRGISVAVVGRKDDDSDMERATRAGAHADRVGNGRRPAGQHGDVLVRQLSTFRQRSASAPAPTVTGRSRMEGAIVWPRG